jgi:acetyl-CoA C-acetyltransferase
VLVGGFDSMTRAPHAVRMRPAAKAGDQSLIDVMVHDGLYCSIADAGMGAMSDAENVRLGISREAQDHFAAASHQRAAAAADRLAEEIVPLAGLDRDEGIRPETTYEALAKLRPAFGSDGTITAGNASQVSDGAAAAVLTTEDRAVDPLGEIVGRAVVAGPDSTLHLRPAEASRKLLERHGLKAADIALWEINEAFAGVTVAAAEALEIELERVNVNGGAVALGHPLAGSGLRLVLTLAYALRRRGGGLGIATLCGGGGQGEAILLRVN